MRRMLCALLALVLVVSLPLTAMAAIEADISYGDATIRDMDADYFDKDGNEKKNETHGGMVTIVHGNGNENGTVYVEAGEEKNSVNVSIYIQTEEDSTTNVVLDNAHIHDPDNVCAPIAISGPGDVVVELEGSNSLINDGDANIHAGLQTSQEGGSLTIQDGNGKGVGKLTAQGGSWGGAGIGGSKGDNGSNITINSGEIVAVGGDGAAGIGGGAHDILGGGGDGSNITINGGTVTAKGGDYGAGIGGGEDGDGSYITINGGTVTATGGNHGAGIGGGYDKSGSNITISGDAEVTAQGGWGSAGIGGGNKGNGSDITVSGSANVMVEGGSGAADIGDGFDGMIEAENQVNVDKLETDGSITYRDGKKVQGTYEPPVPEEPVLPAPSEPSAPSAPSAQPEKPARSTQSGAGAAPVKASRGPATSGYKKGSLWSGGYITRTLFKVENGAGMKPDWSEQIQDGILTITAQNEPVVFTTWLNGLKYLQDMGIKTIRIKTEHCETELEVAKLIAENANEYILTQEGETATLTLDGREAEIE